MGKMKLAALLNYNLRKVRFVLFPCFVVLLGLLLLYPALITDSFIPLTVFYAIGAFLPAYCHRKDRLRYKTHDTIRGSGIRPLALDAGYVLVGWIFNTGIFLLTLWCLSIFYGNPVWNGVTTPNLFLFHAEHYAAYTLILPLNGISLCGFLLFLYGLPAAVYLFSVFSGQTAFSMRYLSGILVVGIVIILSYAIGYGAPDSLFLGWKESQTTAFQIGIRVGSALAFAVLVGLSAVRVKFYKKGELPA